MALPNTLQWITYNDTVHGYITQDRGVGTGTPHYANDVQTPFHTVLGAPWTGTVIAPPGNEGYPYTPWGGQIFVRMQTGSVYYLYHLDLVYPKIGAKVQQGEVLGLSGGQTSGGYHPTSPAYSNGAHTHFGFWTKFVKVNGGQTSIPYGPDITPAIAALRSGSGLTPDVGKGGSNGNLVQTAQTILSGGNTPLTLAPNADVNELLWAFDQVLDLRNPFDHVQTGGTIFDALNAALQIGGNLVDDASAATVRMLFLIAGIFVLFKVTGAFIDYGALTGTIKDSTKTIAEGIALFA